MGWQYEIINGALAHSLIDHDEPAPGQVQVSVEATALNYRDVGIVAGHYPCISPLVPLSDGAGVITKIGDGVTGINIGDRVISNFYPYWHGGVASAENHQISVGCDIHGMLRAAVPIFLQTCLQRHLMWMHSRNIAVLCLGRFKIYLIHSM